MKTWPLHVNETIVAYQQKLIKKAHAVLESEKEKNIQFDLAIAGILCTVTKEQAANMLLHEIYNEQQEQIAINNKYNRLGLDREAIIKTGFFRKIVRKVDLMKDLFFFNTFDAGSSVWAHLEGYNNSIVQTRFAQLIEEIPNLETIDEIILSEIEQRIKSIVDLAKDILWERHSDTISVTGKRRVKLQLLDPPLRTKERLIEWKTEGFTPSLVCHRDSFIPQFLTGMIETITEAILDRKKQLHTAYLEQISAQQATTIFSMIRKSDPIAYIEDGDWTVIIDQYADFPQEQQILFHVKDHYSRLGKQFGVLKDN